MTRLRPAAFWISVAAGIVVLGGCEVPERKPTSPAQTSAGGQLEALHDDARSVTCWRHTNDIRTLSCLPDWMLTKRPAIPVQGGDQ